MYEIRRHFLLVVTYRIAGRQFCQGTLHYTKLRFVQNLVRQELLKFELHDKTVPLTVATAMGSQCIILLKALCAKQVRNRPKWSQLQMSKSYRTNFCMIAFMCTGWNTGHLHWAAELKVCVTQSQLADKRIEALLLTAQYIGIYTGPVLYTVGL